MTFAPQLNTLKEEEHSVLGAGEEQGVRYPSSHHGRKRSRETPSPATGQPKVRSSPRGIMRSLRKITTSTKPTTSTALPEDENASTVGLSLTSEEFLAVQEINMCVHGASMCVATVGGSVLTFDFKMGEVTTTPKVRNGNLICMQCRKYITFRKTFSLQTTSSLLKSASTTTQFFIWRANPHLLPPYHLATGPFEREWRIPNQASIWHNIASATTAAAQKQRVYQSLCPQCSTAVTLECK